MRVFLGERTTEVLGTLAAGHWSWIIRENSKAHTLPARVFHPQIPIHALQSV